MHIREITFFFLIQIHGYETDDSSNWKAGEDAIYLSLKDGPIRVRTVAPKAGKRCQYNGCNYVSNGVDVSHICNNGKRKVFVEGPSGKRSVDSARVTRVKKSESPPARMASRQIDLKMSMSNFR